MKIEDFLDFFYGGKKRKNGEPAVSHCYEVRKILKEAGIKEESILNAAMLHDVIEDYFLNSEYLSLKFGEKVAKLVDILSKNPAWNTSYCKMKSSMDEVEGSWADYPEAVVIKMADRLHNLRTAEGLKPKKRIEYLEETDEILVPLFECIIRDNPSSHYRPAMKKLLIKIRRAATALKKIT
jgi:GTP pyrophosphokinase